MDTKINIYILSIFLKQHNFPIILIVISGTSILPTRSNIHFKLTVYENAVENEIPCWQDENVTSCTGRQCEICI